MVDDMTELYDADVPRVDLVGKGANGLPFLITKQDATAHGLLDPEFVRGLIAKTDAATAARHTPQEMVTMTGSPAAIAAMIHGAAVRKAKPDTAEGDALVKAKYTAEQLRNLADEGHAMRDGDRISYPIDDVDDLNNAIKAVGRGNADHDTIRAFVARRAKEMGHGDLIPDTWAADGSLKKADGVEDAAGESLELDQGVDGMDPTVVLAPPVEDAPGDPMQPGSPAWEAIDAATAMKWTAILSRAKHALGVLADRELMESISADPDDAANACDLDTAADAIDYAISVLAPFAIAEQDAADCRAEQMATIGKSVAGLDDGLPTIEGLAPLAKAGRSLSAKNATALREAIHSIESVLATLPPPPAKEDDGETVAATKEAAMPEITAGDPTAAVSETVEQPLAKTAEPPATVEAVPVAAPLADDVIAKAVAATIAALDAANVRKAGHKSKKVKKAAKGGKKKTAEKPPTDLEAAPPAEVGTPADSTDSDEATVEKTAEESATTDTEPVEKSTPEAVLKGTVEELLKAATDEWSATQAELVAELKKENRALEDRIQTLETAPAVRAVMANGAVPPPHLLRGQDQGAPLELSKGQQLKKALAESTDAVEKKRISDQMQELAIEQFTLMQQRARG